MRRLLYLCILAVCSSHLAIAQQRVVLYQEFTGENCPSCALINPSLWNLLLAPANHDKLIPLTFMVSIPYGGYFCHSDNGAGDSTMFQYYDSMYHRLGGLFAPSGVFDGYFPDSTTGYPAEPELLTQEDIDSEAAVPSPFNIDVIQNMNATKDSVFVNIKITAVSPVSGDSLRLRAAWVKNMAFTAPPGSNGEQDFYNVVRRMYPGIMGSPLPTTWNAGDSHTYNIAAKISGLDTFTNVTSTDSFMVVWVQDENTKYVLQAAATGNTTEVKPVERSFSDVNVYPNPAHSKATIDLTLKEPADIRLDIIDCLGTVVSKIDIGKKNAGQQKLHINTGSLARGMYHIVLIAGNNKAVKQMIVN